MALQLNCSMCNGHIEPDDLAIRRRIVTCPYCATINRIVPTGTEKITEPIPEQFVPETVKIERPVPGDLLVHVDKTEISSTLNAVEKTTIYMGLINNSLKWLFVFLIVGGLVAESIKFLLKSDPAAQANLSAIWSVVFYSGSLILAGMALAFVIQKLKRLSTLPPLRLEGGYVYPASAAAEPIKLTHIRQIFATFTKIEPAKPRDEHDVVLEPIIYSTVFALTQTNERISLIGPLNREEVALYIEEFLESELGLFNFPVLGEHGDEAPPYTKGKTIPTQNYTYSFPCFSCDAILQRTEEKDKRGYVVCEYCLSLTLLYKPDSPLPVLGLPDVFAPTLQIKLKEKAAKWGLIEKVNGEVVQKVQIESELIAVQQKKNDVKVIAISDVINVFVKAFETESVADLRSVEGMNFSEISAMLQEYGKEIAKEGAYSGNIDADLVMRRVRAGIQYKVVAETDDGKAICLLDNILDVREAVMWSEFVCDKCRVNNEKTHHLI